MGMIRVVGVVAVVVVDVMLTVGFLSCSDHQTAAGNG